MRALALALVLLAVSAAPVGAVRIVSRTDAPMFQRWSDRAKVPTVDATILVVRGACPGVDFAAACTARGEPVWIADPMATADDREQARIDLLHELGHQFDFRRLTDRMRDAFRGILGTRRAWESLPEETSPDERFAQAYSMCAWRPRWLAISDFAQSGYSPTVAQHRAVCGLIRRMR